MNQWCVHTQFPRQGTSHKKQGNSPCQDMVTVKENDDVIVAVLSDGLGQLEYSGMAAAAITKSASTYLLNKYTLIRKGQFREEQLKMAILDECKEAILQCSNSLNISVSKMDGTLLFIVLFKDASQFIYGQLGDGAICIVEPHKGFQANTFDDKLKSTSNLTKTVLSRDALEYFNIRICSAEGIMGFFLTTDGLENEIYSKAGKVKKQIEWYFNLISNKSYPVCVSEINKRWDELTSNEKYGFTDDMSLIAIVKPYKKIELPEEANWRCACGNRNRMESTRCESCGKDFLKVYKGINFKQEHGSKLAFFTYINNHPEEELHVLQKYCEYPIEFLKQKYDERQEFKTSNTKTTLHEHPDSSLVIQDSSQNLNNVFQKELNTISLEQQTTEFTKPHKKHNGDIIIGKLKILACLLITFVFGVLSYMLFDLATKDISKSSSEVFNLQKENDNLQSENKILFEKIDMLNVIIENLENDLSKKISIPADYNYYTISNEEVYIGRLKEGLPNGTGVVYSSGMILVGDFHMGIKTGKFYVIYSDGHKKIREYKNDVLISEKSFSTYADIEDNIQSSQIEAPDHVMENAKTYELIYDANVRETASSESQLVTSLKIGDIVQSYNNTLTDLNGVKWLEIFTTTGCNGWIRYYQVQEVETTSEEDEKYVEEQDNSNFLDDFEAENEEYESTDEDEELGEEHNVPED